MLPILVEVVGLIVSGLACSGLASSGMAGMSAMEGTGEGTNDDIIGEEVGGVKTCRDTFPLCVRCPSTIYTLWTTFLS